MRREALSLIVGTVWMFTLLGCSTTRVITPKTGFTLSRDAVLVTTNGARLGTRWVKTTGDSIVARDYTFDRNLHFHFSEVEKVVVKDRGKGTAQGAKLLGAAGALFGLVASILYSGSDHGGLRWVGPPIYGGFGGMVGAIIGALKAGTSTYLFEEMQEETNASERLSDTDAEPTRTNRR